MFHLLVVAALGAPPGRVAVVAICDESPESAAIAIRTAGMLDTRGWQIAHVPEARADWQYRCQLDHSRALEQLDAGKAAFHKMRFRAARKQLNRAREAFVAAGWLGTPPEARDVLVYLGWIALEARDRARARSIFTESLRLWPAWRPDGSQYPPHVIRAFAEAVITAAAQPRGGLAVRTEPANVTVILNGHTELSSPCTFTDLMPGEHNLALRHPGLDTSSRTVTVRAGEVVQLDVDLNQERRDDWWRAITAEDWPAVRALAGADAVLVVVPAFARPGLISGIVVRDNARAVEVSAADIDVAAATLADAVAAPVTVATSLDTPPPPPTEPEPDPGSVLSWWFWTAVAVVGAGAIVGATYAATRPDEMTITVRR